MNDLPRETKMVDGQSSCSVQAVYLQKNDKYRKLKRDTEKKEKEKELSKMSFRFVCAPIHFPSPSGRMYREAERETIEPATVNGKVSRCR